MRIAVPLEGNRLSMHFGRSQSIAFIDVDANSKAVVQTEEIAAPPHEHGVLPRLIAQQGANVVIVGGIGAGALSLLMDEGIEVVSGATDGTALELVTAYLSGTLITGDGACGHHCDH